MLRRGRQNHSDFATGVVKLLALAALGIMTATGASFFTSTSVQADACKSGCIAAYNRCRIATNGSSRCNAQLQACVRRCIRR